jgi:putative hydrolase of the HAD superfamily
MIDARIISLDLDDTLWPVAPVIAAAEDAMLEWLQVNHPAAIAGHDVESMRRLRADVGRRHPHMSHDMTFLRRRALAEQFAAAGYDGVHNEDSPAELAMEIFLAARNRVHLYADVRPALTRLRRTHRLYAMSNGNADLERCGIGDLFDGHVSASGAGAAKPDARIFAHLLELAGVEASEVLHIGDDPIADVAGARRAGMQAMWINRDARAWPDDSPPPRTVSTLAELA